MIVRRIARKATGSIARLAILAVSRIRRDRRVPIRLVWTLRRLAVGPDPLVPGTTARDGSDVLDEQLAMMLRGFELGIWALGPESIDRLLELVVQLRPRLVVEFGSGASTIAIAHALSRDQGSDSRIVALEQDPGHADATRSRLNAFGLDSHAVVLHCPLVREMVEGRMATTFVATDELRTALGERSPDLVLVDGPAAETGGRFATLPLIRRFVGSAVFVLDDALRDSELGTAREWAKLPYLELQGIEPIEKGLLFGSIGSR